MVVLVGLRLLTGHVARRCNLPRKEVDVHATILPPQTRPVTSAHLGKPPQVKHACHVFMYES